MKFGFYNMLAENFESLELSLAKDTDKLFFISVLLLEKIYIRNIGGSLGCRLLRSLGLRLR